MKYIKVRGKNYNEAMINLRMDHGDDAIPISHKYVKEGGLFNSRLFAKDIVEMTAAVQEKKLNSKLFSTDKKVDITVGGTDKNKQKYTSGRDFLIKDNLSLKSMNDENFRIKEKKPEGNNNLSKEPVNKPGFDRNTDSLSNSMKKEKNEIGSMDLKRFENEFDQLKRAINQIAGNIKNENIQSKSPDESKIVNSYRDILKNNDYNEEECNTILNEMKNSISKDDLKEKFKIEKSLKDLIKSKIVTTGPIKKGNRKKIIMFIGPTGVGKTTTMAKLGAIYSLREGGNVTFITIDNYRIAATEQLKKYAEIMAIPVYVVTDQKSFNDTIKNDKSEIIMVDTSGRSHKNELKISEIRSFAEGLEYDVEKILCVSANIKKNDLLDIFKAFNSINFDSIVITKVDETSFIGNVVDVADKYNKPISYYTNGQEVPNDIVTANPDNIVDMIIGAGNN